MKETQINTFIRITISLDEIGYQIEKKEMINKLGLCYNTDEDIKKEMIDLTERRWYAKKEKIREENKKIEKANYYDDECEKVLAKIRKKIKLCKKKCVW